MTCPTAYSLEAVKSLTSGIRTLLLGVVTDTPDPVSIKEDPVISDDNPVCIHPRHRCPSARTQIIVSISELSTGQPVLSLTNTNVSPTPSDEVIPT